MLLHAFIPASRANGPGLRSAVFFQGCTLVCHNCFNPDSHPFSGADVTIPALAERVLQAHKEHGTEGVTFSGGEPMQRAPALLELIGTLRQMASGKFISASTQGMYQYKETQPAPGRRIIRDLGGPLTVMPPSKSEA